ncbi:plasmid stabilization system [Pirellula staleyi DSM 6068]|uniref:Plasmid stabilization system n=1 Tax=Pirellula staleyi (strain ATCC 27377 / DSM 6068 / ICPB 4128) TaxID=530564 RepID=D2R656_PIRSD|nr:type II toxin-antitoxin system RelE/ParE family toxin [Pirellula staleyi]ADB19141.1 plasmid stabilization system [Pirellula staleyi DSM 6068]
MGKVLRYHPFFEEDVVQAAKWYDDRNPVLGADFVALVRLAIQQLMADPLRRSKSEFGFYYWPLKRFPYVVFYDITPTDILILGVMHTSQDSRHWIERRR